MFHNSTHALQYIYTAVHVPQQYTCITVHLYCSTCYTTVHMHYSTFILQYMFHNSTHDYSTFILQYMFHNSTHALQCIYTAVHVTQQYTCITEHLYCSTCSTTVHMHYSTFILQYMFHNSTHALQYIYTAVHVPQQYTCITVHILEKIYFKLITMDNDGPYQQYNADNDCSGESLEAFFFDISYKMSTQHHLHKK